MTDFTKPVRLKRSLSYDDPYSSIAPGTIFDPEALELYFENVPKEKKMNLKDPKDVEKYLEAALINAKEAEDKYHRGDCSITKVNSIEIIREAVKNVFEANKEPEQYAWLNVYETKSIEGKLTTFCLYYSTKEAADKQSFNEIYYIGTAGAPSRISRLKIKLERGRFDE